MLLLVPVLALSVAWADRPAPAAPAPDAAAQVTVAPEGADAATPPDASAPAPGSAEADALASMAAFEAAFTYERGDVSLGGGKAVLHVPEGFGYLDAQEADQVLQAWGNPPDASTLGMIVPTDAGIFADETWVVVLSYDEDGHVADDDAAEVDYGDLLKEMQAGAADDSEQRVQAGLSSVSLVGWAEPPRYDAAAHKLYWAKELAFGDSEDHTLNYAIRVLGRSGVLQLNAVASMGQLGAIKAPMEQVIGFAEFTPGNRYEDFDPTTDHMAEYGIAALVAGGVAAKTGLFKVLLGALVAGKKVVVVAAIAGVAFVKKLLGNKDAGQR